MMMTTTAQQQRCLLRPVVLISECLILLVCCKQNIIITQKWKFSNYNNNCSGALQDNDCTGLLFCVRFLCGRFLLTGVPGECCCDRDVRVSHKSVALQCVTHACAMLPHVIHQTLLKGIVVFYTCLLLLANHNLLVFYAQHRWVTTTNNNIIIIIIIVFIESVPGCQQLTDVLLYSKHSDPQLRAAVVTLIARYFTALYTRNACCCCAVNMQGSK